MAEFRMGVVRANEINFHFLEMGAGPLVLCMHGFPDNAYSFRHLLPELAQAGLHVPSSGVRVRHPVDVV